MRAVVYERYGAPDVLHIEDVERPAPKDNEVLVKIHATTVNRTDSGFRRAKPFITRFFSGLLRRVVEATRYVQTEQKTGNVVLSVSHRSG